MKVLLDTCAFIWLLGPDDRLSSRARQHIMDSQNELVLSAVSVWEIALKITARKLSLPPTLGVIEQMARNSIRELSVTVEHALHTTGLPPHHRDPYDRLLIAQAQLEKLTILTPDPSFKPYDVATLW